jgi:hypothetical protein
VTVVGDQKGGAVEVDTSTKPMPRAPAAPARRAFPAVLPVLAVLATLAVTWWLVTHRATRRGERPSPLPSPVATPVVVLPPPEATAEPLPTIQSTAAQLPAVQPTVPPAIERPSVDEGARRAAARARSQTAISRENARRAHAAELAPTEFEKATAQERKSSSLLERGSFAAAQAGYELAAQLFDTAQMRAETAQREAHRVSALPTPAPQAPSRPEPTRIPATAVAAAEPIRQPTVAHTASVRNVVTEEEKIREVIRAYEKAQSTLDADLYARIYPSVNVAKVRAAFESFRSQTVVFEIQEVTIDPGGSRAQVRGRETRVAMPRVGGEQRDSRSAVIQLKKSGDSWTITRLY